MYKSSTLMKKRLSNSRYVSKWMMLVQSWTTIKITHCLLLIFIILILLNLPSYLLLSIVNYLFLFLFHWSLITGSLWLLKSSQRYILQMFFIMCSLWAANTGNIEDNATLCSYFWMKRYIFNKQTSGSYMRSDSRSSALGGLSFLIYLLLFA